MAYDMYQEIILQHYRSPKNFGPMESPDRSGEESNPNCGDHITVEIKFDPSHTQLADFRFHGDGCAISMASASMLTQKLKGQPLEAVRKFTREDVLALLGIPLSPVRIKCALTAYTALGRALQDPAARAGAPDDWSGEPTKA
jgi:nitrogen fixation NifU-like protein